MCTYVNTHILHLVSGTVTYLVILHKRNSLILLSMQFILKDTSLAMVRNSEGHSRQNIS